MLNKLKALRTNKDGYILVYVIMLMGFITFLFAGTAMALNSRTVVAKQTLASQQLHLTAQSALSTIVDEFENNAELKGRLQYYAEGNQSADFKLTDEVGLTDDIQLAISKESEGIARLTVTATNESGSISTAVALMDYTQAPQGESAGVVDNLIVAYNIGGTPYSQYNLGDNDSVRGHVLDGRVILNNLNKNNIKFKGVTTGGIIANGNLEFIDHQVTGVEGSNGQIVSTEGTVKFWNGGKVGNNEISLVAAKKGIEVMNDDFTWQSPDLDFVTGNGGDIEFKDITGDIGDVISGGDITLNAKDNNPLTINGDILSKGDIELKEQHKVEISIIGNIISGENLDIRGKYNVGGDIAAVANINAKNGQTTIKVPTGGIYAGRTLDLNSIQEVSVNDWYLSGANYRNGDGDSTVNSYLNYTDRGNISFSNGMSKDVGIGKGIVVNDTDGVKHTNRVDMSKVSVIGDEGFQSKFNDANSIWRGLISRVEKGGVDGEGYIDLAVAITGTEVESGTKHDSFTKTGTDYDAYYVNSEGTAVSHNLNYTVNDNAYILRQEIAGVLGGPSNSYDTSQVTIGSATKLFNEAIPDINNIPTVAVPQQLTYTWATLEQDGDELNVRYSGYIKVNNNTITAKDTSGNVTTFTISTNGSLVFDTTNGKHYDIMLGNMDVVDSTGCGGTVNFPWNIKVNQPAENMGYVRFFINDSTSLTLCGDWNNVRGITNIGDEDCIPEVYFFSNGNKTIKSENYSLCGYVIIPHGLVDLFSSGTVTGTSKVFEGLMLCGNVGMPQTGNRVLKYYRPLTFAEAITADVFYGAGF